jgi:hypothetical protein
MGSEDLAAVRLDGRARQGYSVGHARIVEVVSQRGRSIVDEGEVDEDGAGGTCGEDRGSINRSQKQQLDSIAYRDAFQASRLDHF